MTAMTDLAIYDQRKLRLDLIIRTSKRKKDARSPAQQVDIAMSSAGANGHEIVFTHDSGTDESGKTMNRASINAAMARVQAGLTDGVIVALADRIGRAPIEEAMTVVRAFCTQGKLVIADMGGQPIDLTNGVEETNITMQLAFARQYWVATANRFQRSQIDAIRGGRFIGKAPIGYYKVKARIEDGGGKLAEHEHYGPIMREAYRLAAHDGLHAAVKHLRVAVPERKWTTSEVRRVLSKRAYLGELHHGDHVPNLEAHAALTTLDLWLAAQTEPQQRMTDGDYVLSKLATCETCGAGLTGQMATLGDRRQRRYRCSNEACGGGSSIAADALEADVRGVFAPFVAEWDFRVRFEVEGLQDAAEALTDARDVAKRFRNNVRLLATMSDDEAAEMGEGLAAVVAEKRAHYEHVAKLAVRSEQFPVTIDSDEDLLRALRLIEPRIVVKRGRRGGHASLHAPVSVRVSITDENGLDYRAGVAAA